MIYLIFKKVYNDKDQGRQNDIDIILNWRGNPNCTPKNFSV